MPPLSSPWSGRCGARRVAEVGVASGFPSPSFKARCVRGPPEWEKQGKKHKPGFLFVCLGTSG